MPGTVWLLDSTWSPEDLQRRQGRFPELRPIVTRAEIQDRIRKLAKTSPADLGQDFWFVHQSDVGEVAQLLDPLLQSDNFQLFSGASAGADEGVLPRSLVRRQLDDFLAYWGSGDLESARKVLTQKHWWIHQLRLWTDRVQHDYINLLAPIDLLSTALASAEIDPARYSVLRVKMLDRLAAKRAELLAAKGENLRNMARVFEEAIDIVRADDPSAKGIPPVLNMDQRIAYQLPGRVLHVDDEIDKGWDLVMPELFGELYEYQTEPEKALARVEELEQQEQPYVVLLDLGLRSGDSPVPKAWRGLDLLDQLRTRFPAAPVHVFSARNDMYSYRKVVELGGNGFLEKPCRALSSDADATIFARFRGQILSARFDVFRSFLYRAFDALREGLEQGSIEIPFIEEDDPRGRKRQWNLAMALEHLLTMDFERCCRDSV